MQNDKNLSFGFSSPEANPERYLIVGLGNPGADYEGTRHNCGFLVVRKLAEKMGATLRLKSSLTGEAAEVTLGAKKVVFLLPMTYMNRSGLSVKCAREKWHCFPSHILVVSDDAAIPFGTLRLRRSGSAGGHNGLKSVEESLATQEYPRLRIGIGDPKGQDLADYVLERFSLEEQKALPGMVEKACVALELWVSEGIDAAMRDIVKGEE